MDLGLSFDPLEHSPTLGQLQGLDMDWHGHLDQLDFEKELVLMWIRIHYSELLALCILELKIIALFLVVLCRA